MCLLYASVSKQKLHWLCFHPFALVKSVFGLVTLVWYVKYVCACNVCVKGKQRQTMLEKAVSEAQSSESRVQNFQHWIYHVDELLNEHLDNDTTVDDLPHDFQVSSLTLTRLSVCLGYI